MCFGRQLSFFFLFFFCCFSGFVTLCFALASDSQCDALMYGFFPNQSRSPPRPLSLSSPARISRTSNEKKNWAKAENGVFELWRATQTMCYAILCGRHILPIRPLNSGHEPTPLKGLLTAFAPYIALFIGAKGVMGLGILASRLLCREASAAPNHKRRQQPSYSCSDKELPVSIRREIKDRQGDM